MTSVPRARVLIVDDDATVAEILSRYLVREGYAVESVSDGREALERSRSEPPDLICLDLMLPGMSGLDVCRRLRAFTTVPIIMLTARGEESERIFGLRLGADDYVVKPFSPREVTARAAAVLRRVSPERGTIAAGRISVDLGARTVDVDGDAVTLTAREFDLLAFLIQRPGQVFKRDELMERIWGSRHGDSATVTVHIRRLRLKLEVDPSDPAHLQTVWGVGYRFQQ